MRVLLDLNVFLDVFQKRQPHYSFSAKGVDIVLRHKLEGAISGHAITTLYYIIRKGADPKTAREIVMWLVKNFSIAPCNKEAFQLALDFDMKDFEDSVVAASAKLDNCDTIISRNISDFSDSPIECLSPADFLAKYSSYAE